MKILITGGHVTPAIAVIEQLQKDGKWQIYFVGRRKALSADTADSFEYSEITEKKIPFFNLETGRLSRFLSTRSIIEILKIPVGIIYAFKIIRKVRPRVILSFGGYIGLPICLAGYLCKIPIYTHEQTLAPGLSNRIIGIFAKKVFVAFEQSANFFNQKKTIVTGNPLRNDIFDVKTIPFNLSTNKDKKVIFVTGGSTGAHAINIHIKNILPELLVNYIVIHQTGSSNKSSDFNELSKFNNADYHLIKHLKSNQMGFVYNVADIVVGRAGANTFFEIVALKKPAVLIPLPIAAENEQLKQAELLKKYGVAEIFDQKKGSDVLLTLVAQVCNNYKTYKDNFSHLTSYVQKNSANKIIQNLT